MIYILIGLLIASLIFHYLQYDRYKIAEDELLDLEDEIKHLKNIEDSVVKYEEGYITKSILDKFLKDIKLHKIANKELSFNIDYEKAYSTSLVEELKKKTETISKVEQLTVLGDNLKILPDGVVELVAKTVQNGNIFDIKGEKPKTVKRQYNKKK